MPAVTYWRSKFPGFEKKSRKREISNPASTNSACSSSAVNSRLCFKSFSANASKSLATRLGRLASISSSASAIFVVFIFPRRGYQVEWWACKIKRSSEALIIICVTQRKQDEMNRWKKIFSTTAHQWCHEFRVEFCLAICRNLQISSFNSEYLFLYISTQLNYAGSWSCSWKITWKRAMGVYTRCVARNVIDQDILVAITLTQFMFARVLYTPFFFGF